MEINQVAIHRYGIESKAGSSVEESPEKRNAGQPVEQQKVAPKSDVDDVPNKLPPKSAEPIENVAKELQGLADSLGRSVQFKVNEESGDDIIMVFHKKTKELIRQIPSEEVVEIRERLSKVFGGIIEEQI
jgi:flagellar protein FlaG